MNSKFELISDKTPKGDQIKTIKELSENIGKGIKKQTLYGATGTGKTFSIANVIKKTNKQTLVIVQNKTLAGQIYAELKGYFPNNRVEYFISNFDYYRPEAYIAGTDTYVEKKSQINWDIEMMRINTMNSLMTRDDTIVVTSVASIFSLRDPNEYSGMFYELEKNEKVEIKKFISSLISMGYKRNNVEKERGTFRVIGDVIDIFISDSEEIFLRVDFFDNIVDSIKIMNSENLTKVKEYERYTIFPIDSNATKRERVDVAIGKIESELITTLDKLKKENKLVEEQRLRERTRLDIERLKEYGTTSGIENYAMYLDGRNLGDTPYSLVDYFNEGFLTVIDESHITLPQIKGMYFGDRSRKKTLVDYGFRLPSALENRPLNFDEFVDKTNYTIYASATPGDYELEISEKISEQIIRPTGLLDPTVEIRKNENRIVDLISEIKNRAKVNEKTLVTVLTIKMAEALCKHMREEGVKVAYLHSELKTLERDEVIRRLRIGVYDAIVGINLLREGIDIPEASLVAILDADQDGLFRNYRSLVQTIGRAARNVNGNVIMYADRKTVSMEKAIEETNRRRKIQSDFNELNNITPKTIVKEIPKKIIDFNIDIEPSEDHKSFKLMSSYQKNEMIRDLKRKMHKYSEELDFENAMRIRDIIIELKNT